MARLSKEQREEIVALWKAGKSQNRLAKDFGVSKATINKICKNIPQENVQIVNTQIAINTALSSKSEQEVNAVYQVVDEKMKHLNFFKDSALKNQMLANQMLEKIEAIHELEAHARITAKNKETVLGKDIETQINIQNNQTVDNRVFKIEVVGVDEDK